MEKGELRVRCPRCETRFRLRWRPDAEPDPDAPDSPEPRPAAPAPAADSAATPAPPEDPAQVQRRLERRARRLARALAQELLQGPGRRDRRDAALAAGRLLAEFGPEIQRAWRAYVERVGEDFARSNPQFRDAFNEIVADGHPLF
jgi:hypothetical protein